MFRHGLTWPETVAWLDTAPWFAASEGSKALRWPGLITYPELLKGQGTLQETPDKDSSRRRSLLATDYFVVLNMFLFMLMCWAVYYDRLVAYRGVGNLHEFFLYACAIISTIFVIWWYLRRLPFPTWLLFIIQIGILMHFAGAFFPIEGGRMYDAIILGLRYDKYVHAFNAFAGAALVRHLFKKTDSRSPLMATVVVMVVLGAGAVVEIVEYLVSLTVKHNGVGSYDNNMQDLIANLFGALLFECGHQFLPISRSERQSTGREVAAAE